VIFSYGFLCLQAQNHDFTNKAGKINEILIMLIIISYFFNNWGLEAKPPSLKLRRTMEGKEIRREFLII
jgi:hypothetical protein